MPEGFRTFYADPGEDFGWAIGQDVVLQSRGIGKMWEVLDDLWAILQDPQDPCNELNNAANYRDNVEVPTKPAPIQRIVCEDFRIYPWAAKSLAWDPVRTARAIGAMTFMARLMDIPIVFQPAAIKKAAMAAGAGELFDTPEHPNRHSNDAIQHFVFFSNTELLGLRMPVPDNVTKEEV